ncbi:signal transduction histidine kinase [Thermocatellispora tengchongensis]|uniref:histidine kinase n=1 Tax=Thermocatellispora tengchongensis TaxID=1073253 RepID=A0A840P8N5_9ACTN|nr:sensor histidine kinase [Thermocatellispora tengchongensis]MBB5135652.1 signal transduction histidine kinase [Thermocatellispora tengchongensis]
MTRDAFEALDRLAGGLGTALLAFATLTGWVVVGAACLIGIGLPMVQPMLSVTRSVAERERVRLGRWGEHVVSPYPAARPAKGWRTDPATLRDLIWLAVHGSFGLLLGLLGIALPVMGLRDASFPLWWHLLPDGETGSSLGIPVHTWPGVMAVSLSGFVWLAISMMCSRPIARLQSLPGRRLLTPHPSVDLSERVARLTATRAGALAAHAAELRRIERALHDGAQNRLLAVVVMATAAKRALERDPATIGPALDRVQIAAEQALAELRGVVRSILPPILENKGLAGALSALATGSPIPCDLSVGQLGHLPLSVEATAYFTVAEALTNAAKHSGATRLRAEVARHGEVLQIEVEDDGVGGAWERDGSGLAGIRRRVEAHDGSLTLTSPRGGPTRMKLELPCAS